MKVSSRFKVEVAFELSFERYVGTFRLEKKRKIILGIGNNITKCGGGKWILVCSVMQKYIQHCQIQISEMRPGGRSRIRRCGWIKIQGGKHEGLCGLEV